MLICFCNIFWLRFWHVRFVSFTIYLHFIQHTEHYVGWHDNSKRRCVVDQKKKKKIKIEIKQLENEKQPQREKKQQKNDSQM